jgi:hypothetical protein
MIRTSAGSYGKREQGRIEGTVFIVTQEHKIEWVAGLMINVLKARSEDGKFFIQITNGDTDTTWIAGWSVEGPMTWDREWINKENRPDLTVPKLGDKILLKNGQMFRRI